MSGHTFRFRLQEVLSEIPQTLPLRRTRLDVLCLYSHTPCLFVCLFVCLSFTVCRRLPSDRCNWSDMSGLYERTREGYMLPSSQWQWVGQWTVDTKPEQTDKDGWQYAVDFPR